MSHVDSEIILICWFIISVETVVLLKISFGTCDSFFFDSLIKFSVFVLWKGKNHLFQVGHSETFSLKPYKSINTFETHRRIVVHALHNPELVSSLQSAIHCNQTRILYHHQTCQDPLSSPCIVDIGVDVFLPLKACLKQKHFIWSSIYP